MSDTQSNTKVCVVCSGEKHSPEVPAQLVRPAIAALIKKAHPDWSSDSVICQEDLDFFRSEYVQNAIESEQGELGKLEKDVVRSLRKNELLSQNLNKEFDSKMTFGEKAADKVAEFGGSWRFIGIFAAVILFWISINVFVLASGAFDPYPFILLNLVLSCLASLQAPIIMMSQNRASAKDRLQAEHDYKVNLKAEVEIRNLHEKLDHLLQKQWQRLLEIQQVQTDLIEEIGNKSDGRKG